MTGQELRAHGVSQEATDRHCAPGGLWQMLLPGVVLLHTGPPTGEELLHAALRYAAGPSGEVMVTGLAALRLHGFSAAPALCALGRVEVLVPRAGTAARSTSRVRLVRSHCPPQPVERAGFPTAPVPRALADAIARIPDAAGVATLLAEAVRGGHCDPQSALGELSRAGVAARPHVASAVERLRTEERALAEERLGDMVELGGLPDPCWNVELRLPGGTLLGGVDAYWPEHGVAVDLDTRATSRAAGPRDTEFAAAVKKRRTLERLGISLLALTPHKLRASLEQQADVVRTALLHATMGPPPARVVVLPR